MRKICFILLFITTPLLFSNFGMVEYTVLHPKTKSVQTDSLARKQKPVNLYAQDLKSTDVKQEEEKASNMHWGDYLVLGIKAIGGLILKLLAHL
jgi:hypothetical protein